VLALTNRANILLQLGRAEEAILSCNEVLQRDPEHPQSLGIRGAALISLDVSKRRWQVSMKPSVSIPHRQMLGLIAATSCRNWIVVPKLYPAMMKLCASNLIILKPYLALVWP